MKELQQLIKISNVLQRVALSLFIFFWAEFILMFTKYLAPGQLLYLKYGVNGMSTYFVLILTLMIFLSYQSTKIDSLVNKIIKNNPDIN